jgi:hypothetical protein
MCHLQMGFNSVIKEQRGSATGRETQLFVHQLTPAVT